MTEQQLAKRVEHWRSLLAPEWRITLDPAGPHPADEEDQYNACVQADDDYLHARLWVRQSFYRDAELGEVDVTLVHELLHLLLRELRRIEDLVRPHLTSAVSLLLADRQRTEEERVVERLARIIARLEHPDGLLYGTSPASTSREGHGHGP